MRNSPTPELLHLSKVLALKLNTEGYNAHLDLRFKIERELKVRRDIEAIKN